MRASMLGVTKRIYNSSEEESTELRRGPWTLQEDTLLTRYIARHGEGRWNMLAKCAGLKRTGKSCRLRWLNYLKPDIKRGNLSPEEQLLILELHSKWGNRSFWIPRLLQKMEQASYSSSLTTLDSQSQDGHGVRSPPSDSTVPSSLSTLLCPTESKSAHYSNLGSEKPGSVTSPYVLSTNSNTVSPQPATLEHPTCSPLPVDALCKNLILSGSCYDLDGFDQASAGMGAYDNSPLECQMGEGNWVFDSMEDTLWDMDDTWQFRDLRETGI
ncbi:hypothetical protein SADUNF_Sadunf10G0090200 [Salix dunnii]|uniref:Uncharacterized protein n=1 Tax=Salix dunnii TaxID=1413687 RepID=A0A835MUM1_9ROSI|nr:hypothetical protein SADUNF_Sadunf10G0090200 [Salix dunnii]